MHEGACRSSVRLARKRTTLSGSGSSSREDHGEPRMHGSPWAWRFALARPFPRRCADAGRPNLCQ